MENRRAQTARHTAATLCYLRESLQVPRKSTCMRDWMHRSLKSFLVEFHHRLLQYPPNHGKSNRRQAARALQMLQVAQRTVFVQRVSLCLTLTLTCLLAMFHTLGLTSWNPCQLILTAPFTHHIGVETHQKSIAVWTPIPLGFGLRQDLET